MDLQSQCSYYGVKLPGKTLPAGIFCIARVPCVAVAVVSGNRAFSSFFEILWYYAISAPYPVGGLLNLLSKRCKFGHC